MKNIFTICFLILLGSKLYSQEDTSEIINEKLFQFIEDASENIEDGQFYDLIDYLILNPIDLNSANKDQLLRIPFLTPEDAEIILKERKKRNGYKSLNELLTIKNIHPDLILLLKPFLSITEADNKNENKPKKYTNFTLNLRSRLISDLQDRSGFINNKFGGDKLKSYNRIKARFGNYNAGLILEKDPGEISYNDHYAGFVSYNSPNFIRHVIIGDFNYEFGQGLALWSPYSFSKGTEAVSTPIKRDRNFTPHLSSEENKFFRGTAVSFYYSNFRVSGFYSSHNIDASITGTNEITNFYLSGYHRTDTEISKKNILKENAYGANLNYVWNDFFALGVLHYVNKFSKPFAFTSQNELSGDYFSFSSFNYNLYLNRTMLSGELSYNNSSFAFISNLYFSLTDQIELLTSYRNYSPSYYNIYANGFGENGNTKNEIGYYFGTKIGTGLGTFNFYYDIFSSPNQSFKSEFPSSGNDFLINFSTRILDNTNLYLKYKREEKEISVPGAITKEIEKEIKSNYRLEVKYKLDNHFYGKTRFELVNYLLNGKVESGYLTYQEIKYQIQNSISLTSRIIFFDTKSYNSRLYEFENDLRGLMTNIPMFGEGLRWYVLINYQPFKELLFYIKYSETYKPNIKSISSGNSEIIGNVDNRASFQIDYNF